MKKRRQERREQREREVSKRANVTPTTALQHDVHLYPATVPSFRISLSTKRRPHTQMEWLPYQLFDN